jgi:3-keto-L-gulonate-6-phosphate decarboxylase
MLLTRTGFFALFVTAVASPVVGAAQPPTMATCTNLASGVSWQITIDFGNSTVDSNPAQISNTTISWHDGKDGGNYTLDRKSGKLTVVVASSTGGYFLYDRCRLEN